MMRMLRNALSRRGLASLVALGLSAPSAHALVFLEETTFYITSAAFKPGDMVSTRLTFATNPGVELSAFSFILAWTSPMVRAMPSGSGSIEAWAADLSQRGKFQLISAQPQAITGSWVANSLSPSPDVIPIPYEQPMLVDFGFQTSTKLIDSFVISIELYDMADGSGETIDPGSGMINWATMTPIPVPEPASAALMLLGITGLTGLSALRRARRPTAAV